MWESHLCPSKRQMKQALLLQHGAYGNQQMRCFCSLISLGVGSFDYTRCPCADLVPPSLPKPATTRAYHRVSLNCYRLRIVPSHTGAEFHSRFAQAVKWSTRCQPVQSYSAHTHFYWILVTELFESHIKNEAHMVIFTKARSKGNITIIRVVFPQWCKLLQLHHGRIVSLLAAGAQSTACGNEHQELGLCVK